MNYQPLKPKFNAFPAALTSLPLWNCWAAEPRKNGKMGKPPIAANGRYAKPNDPATFGPYETAKAFYAANQGKTLPGLKGPISGAGILLTADCGLVGIDFDAAIDDAGNFSELAQLFLPMLRPCAYCELSPSGHGIRAFLYGRKPDGKCRRGNLEIYDSGRFLTITGHKLDDCPDTPASGEKAQSILNSMGAWLNQTANASPLPVDNPYKPQRERVGAAKGYGQLDDGEILEIIDRAKNAGKFNALFHGGDISGYNSASEARFGLADMLAFYTDSPAQIDRLMRQSALLALPGQMEKWERVGNGEIAKAITGQTAHYSPARGKGKAKSPQRERGGSADKKSGAKEETAFIFSEDAISLQFEAKYKDSLRFDHDKGRWYGWNGKHWEMERTKRGFDLIRDICRNLSKDTSAKEAFYLKKAATASAVERFAQAARCFATTNEIWDQDDFLLGTPDGTVDLQTGKLRPAKREDFITRITAIAPEDKIKAPLWFAFLEEATRGNDGLIDFLQQIAGMCLTGSTREHSLFFVYGAGGNGKSVFLNAITEIMGQYAANAPMETFTASQGDRHPTELAMLCGARLVTASETEEGRAWAESKIKALTGGDPITARFMRRDFFTFLPKFKLLIIGNHKPAIRSIDDAMRRRINIIPFTNKPANVDPKLGEKLRAEYPAILRWMIAGCVKWIKYGLQRPECVTAATNEYFETQDSFGQWLEECCTKDHQFSCTSAALYASWKDFADKSGVAAGSSKSFAGEMQKRGYERIRNSQGKRAFGGITLKNQEYQDNERGCPNDF